MGLKSMFYGDGSKQLGAWCTFESDGSVTRGAMELKPGWIPLVRLVGYNHALS